MNERTEALVNEKVAKLLFTYALPAIIATTASSLYNIIDRIFIGQGVGVIALAGLGLTLPIMNLAVAFGTLVGAGSAALVSIRIGEGRRQDATQILCNALILNIIISLLFTIIVLIFLDPILLLFGADAETLPYAKSFLQIILLGNIFTHLLFGLNSIMRASGYPVKAMLSVLITVVCNIILAPLFIFVLKWGIQGAATATVISQFIGMSWVLAHFLSRNSYIHFEKSEMRLKWKLIGDVFAIGLSPFFIHVCASLVTIIMNWRLKEYGGNLAIAAFGIIGSIQSLVVTFILGLTHGMQPIVGFNYGAKKYDRAVKTFRLTVMYATAACAVGFIAVMTVPGLITRAFTNDPTVIALTVPAMRLCCAMMLIVGFQVVTSNFFQSIDMAKISIFLSLSRQIIFLLPFIVVLPLLFGLNGAWGAMPAADLLASGVTAVILFRFFRKMGWL